MAAYRGGQVQAFETLLGRYRNPVFNFVLRFVRERSAAEEIYQDVWLKVIERSDDFRGDAKFSTWLYAIARNQCIDHQRRMRFRRHAPLDDPDGRTQGATAPTPAHNPGPSTEELAAGGHVRDRIAQAVESLPDEQREIFLMRHLQGLAFDEIAAIVGVSPNTVKSRLRYAMERLRLALKELRDDGL